MPEEQLKPFVSVVIPVYNDAQRLKICLETLEKQSYPQDRYEVIVVDNGSDERLEPIVSGYRQAKLTYEDYPTSYAARNQGISLAQGEIIAFTDADCIPKINWIEKGVSHLLKNHRCGLVAGNITLFFKDRNRPTAVELYERIYGFNQKDYVERENFGATANVFTWKKVILKVGNFQGKLKSNGDRDWGNRVTSAGYHLIYADDAIIEHPARYSFQEIYQKTIRLYHGHIDKEKLDLENPKIDLVKNFFTPYKQAILDLFPLMNMLNILVDTETKGLVNKFKVIGVLFFVRYVRNLERLRLLLGINRERL